MKYIDAEKLKTEIINRMMSVNLEELGNFGCHRVWAYNDVKDLITSLQQEQTEVPNGKFVFPKYLYARTKDNKTIDMSYAPQDMNAIEYIRNDFIQQEQPEMDIEKFTEKMDAWKSRYNHPDNIPIKATMAFTARMFYQYPNVARQWYEQLPKATMDNAKKED